jgi:flagellar basal-body rod modification protein FlgD
MSTSPINGAANVPAAGLATTPANMQINETDFLKLITTQLTEQNPLSPADPTQFVSQLEGMSEVSSMQTMQNTLQSSALMNGSALIGKSVLAPGSSAVLATGGSISGSVTAPAGTSKLSVTISDSSGNPVTTFNVVPAASGMTSFSWNGQTATGAPAPAGSYRVAVNATVGTNTQPVAPNVVTRVDSVLVDPSTQQISLDTDAGTVPLTSVVSVM